MSYQLWEMVYTPDTDVVFPEQLECLEKTLPNGFGGNLVITGDLIILNILHFTVFLKIYLF